MHNYILDTVRTWKNNFGLNDPSWRVIELGSQDFNGSVRPFFDHVDTYIGVDMQPGPGVDIVCDVHNLTYIDDLGQYDLVLCLEMLEHDVAFWRTMEVIKMLLKPSGRMILSARGATTGKPGKNGESMWEHGYPHDYWRFMPQAVAELHALAGCELLYNLQDTQHPGFISYGVKT